MVSILIGFSMKNTIHFGVPLILETSMNHRKIFEDLSGRFVFVLFSCHGRLEKTHRGGRLPYCHWAKKVALKMEGFSRFANMMIWSDYRGEHANMSIIWCFLVGICFNLSCDRTSFQISIFPSLFQSVPSFWRLIPQDMCEMILLAELPSPFLGAWRRKVTPCLTRTPDSGSHSIFFAFWVWPWANFWYLKKHEKNRDDDKNI